MRNKIVSKVLSPNDTGETGAHQSGILIPKDRRLIQFFPELLENEKNPRVHLTFRDDTGKKWVFAYIHYNSKKFGGTRDEYRLTRMTKYIRENSLLSGDVIHMTQNPEQDYYSISYSRKDTKFYNDDDEVLIIGKSWVIV